MQNKDGKKMEYEKFEKLLQENKVTPYKVAMDTGISPSILSYWKTGRSKPKLEKLKILADYFHVNVDYFCS